MRNYVSLIVTFVLLFCLGCGSAESMDGNGSPMEPSPNTSSNSDDSVFEDDLGVSDGESIPSSEAENDNTGDINIKEIEYVAVQTKHIYEEYVDRETNTPLVHMNYHVLSLEEGNETLEQTISKWMVKRQQDLEEDGLELMVKAKNKQKETGNTKLTASLWHEITLHRVDERMISFVERQYTYSIDAWDNDYQCVNYDVKSGKNLLLHDVLVDKEGFRNAVISYCVDELERSYTNTKIDITAVESIYQSITTMGNWCLDASGFLFVYEDDEMKYSHEGVLYVHIPYEKVVEYMDPKYLWGDVYGIASLSYEQTGTIDIDGLKQEIRVEMQYDEYGIERPKLIYGDTVFDMSQHMRTSNVYLICHENWNYLVMTVDMASSDYQTYFYPLSESGVGQVFVMDGGLDAANVSANSFHLSVRVDAFGTYQSYPEYFLVENGTVGAYRMDFNITHTNYEWCELVTVRELPVTKVDKKVMLPVGSRLRIVSTDNVSWAKFLLLNTMEEVIVEFQRGENYILSVDGVSEYEYFAELPYAG